MSGRKHTKIELQRPVTQVLETYRQVEEKLLDIETFGASVQRLKHTEEELASSRRKIVEEVRMLKLDMEQVTSVVWDKVLDGCELTWVQALLQEILKKLTQLENKCLEAEKAKVKVASIYYRLLQKKQRLQHWMPEVLDKSDQRWKKILQAVKSFQSRPVESEVCDGLISRMEMLSNKLSTMIKVYEQNHARRLYVVKAVKKVCEKMGFVIRDQSHDTLSKTLHLTVDTIFHGTMTFNFTLPGEIHTHSQQTAVSCEKNYWQLEQNLEKLGIITDFKYEIDGRPINKENELDDILQEVEEEFYQESTSKDATIHTHSKG